VDILERDSPSGALTGLGKGICNYSAQELSRVKGMKSKAIQDILPRATEEAVHRDYLVLD
jgi:glutamate 5-kinase